MLKIEKRPMFYRTKKQIKQKLFVLLFVFCWESFGPQAFHRKTLTPELFEA